MKTLVNYYASLRELLNDEKLFSWSICIAQFSNEINGWSLIFVKLTITNISYC